MSKSKYKKLLIIVLFIISMTSCNKQPNYPVTPQIEFVESKKFTLLGNIDSVYVKIKFKDGDGNLGLNSFDAPKEEFTLIDTIKNLPYDDFNCENFITINGDRDTVKIFRNPTYFNFFVTFYKKNINGTYTKIIRPDCRKNNGRFSRFDPDKGYSGALEGFIEYNFKGSFSQEFKNTTVQLEIYIMDRALNESNRIRTSDIKF